MIFYYTCVNCCIAGVILQCIGIMCMCTLIQYIIEYSATHDVLKMCIYNYMHTCALPFPARCTYRIAGNIGENYIWRFG